MISVAVLTLASCSSVEPNYEGVLMNNYGRNGESDFTSVKGRQWTIAPGVKLYQVPMFETSGDPDMIQIIFNYKHLGENKPEIMFNELEDAILNKLVINAYRELARSYTTDSLMNNLNSYEILVENKLRADFSIKFMLLENLTSGLLPPKSMGKAIELRNNAVQKANQIENEVRVAKMLQEKAKIEAETNNIKAEGLNDKILKEKWINAIRYSKNRIIITDGNTPIMLGN